MTSDHDIRPKTNARIWLVLSDKLGDNAQVEIIAQALDVPYEIKRVYPLEKYVFGKPRFRPSVAHIDLERSDALAAPWPDLIITIGRRPAMVAMWIRAQSGGKVRIVLLGRPRRWLDKYDLIIAPSQYRVPQHPNILHLDLPLMRPDSKRIEAARQAWQQRMQGYKPPIIALLVGGPTRPYKLDAQVASDLMSKARCIVDKTGGTLYVSTSRRTPRSVVEVIERELPADAVLYRWGDDGENPYFGLLALANYFIVTGDSVSMMVEVVRLGKPLSVFPLPSKRWGAFWQSITRYLHPESGEGESFDLLKKTGDALFSLGIAGYSRDLSRVHRYLVAHGYAVHLGDDFIVPENEPPNELGRVVSRIKELMR